MPVERRRVYYSGRVQGVGFRFTAQDLAQRFGVAGFVRNLDDGRVELLAEGEAAEVAAFLDAVRREMDPYILDVQEARESPGDPPLRGFSVRP
jgi:acylphosphatase